MNAVKKTVKKSGSVKEATTKATTKAPQDKLEQRLKKEERLDKAVERMRRRRLEIASLPQKEQDALNQKKKESQARYRERNRDRISSYMRERYRTSQSISKTPPRTSGATRNADHASLQYALIDLRVALREFSSVVGTCPKSYTGDIYHRWWNTQSSKTTILDAAVLHLDGLLSTVSSSHSAILQIAGVGDQLAEADSAGSRIREVVRLLEDILCAALVGRGVADNMYRRKAFVFQSP